MAATFQPLIQGAYLPNAIAAQYTTQIGQRVRIDQMSLTNHSASPVAVTIQIVPSGAAAANQYRIMETLNIPADGEPKPVPGIVGHVLRAGDTIQAFAGTANVVTLYASGVVFS